jgi:orotate phosphoribosyltransferase
MVTFNIVLQEKEMEMAIRSDRERLLDMMKREKALLYGNFTLSSGKRSSYYFDGKMISLHPEGAYLIGRIMFHLLAHYQVDAVGGLGVGADPLATSIAITSHLEGKPISAFIVREQRKEHGTQKEIEGRCPKGGRVAIVDDVVTRGSSILKAIEAVEAQGCQVVKVIALLDRHEGGSDELKRKGYDFTAIFSADAAGEVTIGESPPITR